MKKMLWILTVALLPSLSFAQSRGDMIVFQGPTGAMSTLANKNQRLTAEEEQAALAKVLKHLSKEGQAFKQVIDGFKSVVSEQLSNEQQDKTATVNNVVAELVSRGHMTEAFNSYVTIQNHQADLLDKALSSPAVVNSGMVSAKDISEAYVGFVLTHYIDKKHADSQKEKMLKERHALLRYLNQFDGILLSDYLNNNLANSTWPQDVLSQAQLWQQELEAAQTVPMF